MNLDFFEGLGLLISTIVVGGICLEIAEMREARRHNQIVRRHREAAQPPKPSHGPLPSPSELESFLARMEPVRRALSRMTEQERDHWHRRAQEVIKEIRTTDEWLQAISTWAPHQREAVEKSAQDKVQARQRLIMDFARGVLQAKAPSPSDAKKPSGEN